MPYPNEHAARITDPEQYDRIRRVKNKFGAGIHVLFGIKDEESEVQAIRFDASKFTAAEARQWLKDHDYKPIEFSEATGSKEADMEGEMQEASREELKEAQQKRASKYGIAPKPGGHLTPPKGYPESESLYGDPVNYRYPFDPTRRMPAMRYFNQREHQSQGGYNDAEWGKIGRRIAKALGEDYQYDAESKRVIRKETEAISLDERSRWVRDAWRAQFDKPNAQTIPQGELWPKEVFEDSIIIETPEGLFSYSYTIHDDGGVEFGEPIKVEVSYRKVNEYLEVAICPRSAEAEDGDGFEGREWDVTIIGAKSSDDLVQLDGRKFVKSKNGRLYEVEALKESVPMWEGVKVYDNHLTDAEFQAKAGMRSVAKEWIGSITQPKWVGGALPRLDGVLKIVEEAVAKKLKAAWDQGVLGTIGLSIDALTIQGQEAEIEGQRLPVMEGFQKILSVDLVAEPAAGGGFNRLIAANISQEVTLMDKEQLKQLVTQLVTEALADSKIEDEKKEAVIEAIVNAALAAKMTEAEDPKAALEPLVKAMIVVESQEPEPEAEPGPEPEPVSEPEPRATGPSVEEQVRKLECKIMLRDKLDEAKLSEPMRRMLEGLFDGKIFETADLDQAIKRAKEAQAAHDPGGRVTGAGGQPGRISTGLDERDKAEIEFMRLLMGNTAFRALENVEDEFVKERVTESYRGWVKAGRPRYGIRRLSEWVYQFFGDPYDTNGRFYEASTTSSMSSIVKNAMNVMLANDYAKRQRWWDPIVRIEEVDTIDPATLVRVFGLNALEVVDEGQAYNELGWVDEEETASFVKKGNYIGITLETLLSDKVQAVRTIPTRLAASWYNTVSALVSGVFTCNSDTGPQLADGQALFNNTAVT
ncbi:MAG: hypothetical protein ACFE9A_21290, partial [Candidatus Hodarchaeota archaeon]